MEEAKLIVLTQLLAFFGSLFVVIISELFKNKYLVPRNELKGLRVKVSETLIKNACYYCNPQNYDELTEKGRSAYLEASKELRLLSAEVTSFSVLYENKTINKISSTNIKDAGTLLMGLSNSLYRYSDDASVINTKNEEKIKELLKL